MTNLTADEVQRALHGSPPANGNGHGRPTLSTLMNRHGTDKLWLHRYDREYARHFEPNRDETFRLLEIGIGGYTDSKRGGESLKV